MLKLWQINFNDGDHEEETALFVHTNEPRPDTNDARQFLLGIAGAVGSPDRLEILGVYEMTTAYDKQGNPYQIIID